MSRVTISGKVADQGAIDRLNERDMPRPMALHMLSVGPLESASILHDALFDRQNWRMTIAIETSELAVIPRQQSIHVAILHSALSALELLESCLFIRRQWPHAGIMVIRGGEGFLDDALYDDRQTPATAPHRLLASIEQLAAESIQRRSGNAQM